MTGYRPARVVFEATLPFSFARGGLHVPSDLVHQWAPVSACSDRARPVGAALVLRVQFLSAWYEHTAGEPVAKYLVPVMFVPRPGSFASDWLAWAGTSDEGRVPVSVSYLRRTHRITGRRRARLLAFAHTTPIRAGHEARMNG